YFVNEHFLRYLGKRLPADYDTVPIVSFWMLHLVWLFPFSVFLPLACRRLRDLRRPKEREDQLRLFAWLWALVVIGFFSFSTRQEYYTFPAFPALALLAGAGLARGEVAKSRRAALGPGPAGFFGAGVCAPPRHFCGGSPPLATPAGLSPALTNHPA